MASPKYTGPGRKVMPFPASPSVKHRGWKGETKVIKKSMENKTTTELLDLLWKLENAPEGKQDWDKFGEVIAELRKRTPFSDIIGEKDSANEYSLEERIESLEEDMKLLKRHKHDSHTGDVLVRI